MMQLKHAMAKTLASRSHLLRPIHQKSLRWMKPSIFSSLVWAWAVMIASGFEITISSGTGHRQQPHVYLSSYKRRATVTRTSLHMQTDALQSNHISFVSPLLEDGYPPAVTEYQQQIRDKQSKRKPLLLYLPGFDGTLLAPFIQFPSLGEVFDVRGMRVGMDNRSTFDELSSIVLDYIISLQAQEYEDIYLMGESFGGILAIEVARDIQSNPKYANVQLKGLILINPATSYLRSALYKLGPPVANYSSLLPPITFIRYLSSLIGQLVPLFLDEGNAFQQLLLMLSSKALPIVLNTPQREAYLGRVAFDLPNRLKFMPQETLKWRLEEWLENGCKSFESRFGKSQHKSCNTDAKGLESLKSLKTLIVAGELDLTLPSVEEANRLSSNIFVDAKVHVVEGAGHASTSGGSLQLIQLISDFFPNLSKINATLERSNPPEDMYGLVPRYDRAPIGMSPLKYWSKEHYQKLIPVKILGEIQYQLRRGA